MTTPEVVLITGISGSGKSVALHALEDAGYFCVDNLPPELLMDFVRLELDRYNRRQVAVAVDARTAGSLPALIDLIDKLERKGTKIRSIFLDANTPALIRRYSETRRPHPLLMTDLARDQGHALLDAIEQERGLLEALREVSTVLDTSQLRPAQLRAWVRDLVGATTDSLTLVFESFAFKYGVPLDADFVFDLRVLPNPFYVKELRTLTGRDAAVARFLDEQPEAGELLTQIETFLRRWIPGFESDQRSYLTVALGCTGGQHRSVYGVELLARRFKERNATLMRHRELDTGE
jgi:RNase adapter protein RapZ